MPVNRPTIIRTASEEEFEQKAFDLIKSAITSSIASKGSSVVGLSGGSTPKPIYRKLGEDSSIHWSEVTLVLIDERYVPSDDSDSNQAMIRSALLEDSSRKPRVIFPDTALPLDRCIAEYAKGIEGLTMDVAVLGMGPDGHIASLFPPLEREAFGPEAVIHTTTRSTGSHSTGSGQAGRTDRFAVRDRISLTLPVLKAARQRIFLITGREKSELLSEMLSSNEDASMYPAQCLLDERTTWIVG